MTDTKGGSNTEVTLADILEARDLRAGMQTRLRGLYPGCTLICVTIVAPGKIKMTRASEVAARASARAIRDALGAHIIYTSEEYPATGYEAFYVVDLPPDVVKRTAVGLEDSHPLGRLFDIDVFGAGPAPLSRRDSGLPPRRCLLCDQDARICMRSGSHSYSDLINRIATMVARYEHPS